MNEWVLATLLGLLGIAGMFGLAALSGYTPRRLAWQDLSRVRRPDATERDLLRTAIKASLKIYLPVLAGAVIVGAYMLAEGSPFGVTVMLCFGAPPVLAVIRAVRVLRYLNEA